jgi:putative CocE/NonD family hydrolase
MPDSLPIRDVATSRMTLSDGIELVADIWRPAAAGRFPVLLMRQPYGRRIASTLVYAHPAWYAANGYIVVIQDVRGSGDSGGAFRLLEDDATDGSESVEWAAGLPGSSGAVGMYGFSYQGTNQLLALSAGAPVKALAPAMIGWTMGTDWAWENGAFCLAANVGWALQMAALQARRAGDGASYAALKAASGALPLSGPVPARPEILERHAGWTHYRDWIDHKPPAPYWDRIAPAAALAGRLEAAAIPMLHVGGWFDGMLAGTLGGYRELAGGTEDHRLIVGPWTHVPWGRVVGAFDLGDAAASPVDRAQIAFFDHHLKGIDDGGGDKVRLFDLAAHRWRAFPAFPESRSERWFLASDGLAATDPSAARLAPEPLGASTDRIVHDPWRPAPSLGGHAAPLSGMRDRAAVDARADILTYTSALLAAPLPLAGAVALELHVESDAASFDIEAVLSMVRPDGIVLNLTQGYASVAAAAARPLRLDMRATCATIPTGFALRLSIAGASFPAYPVNPGTGTLPTEASLIEQRPVTIAVLSGTAAPSSIALPVLAQSS